MNGIILSEKVKEFISHSKCVALNIMTPPTIRACFQDTYDDAVDMDPGFNPDTCVVLAMDYDVKEGRLVLVWIDQADLIKAAEGKKDA